MQVTEDYRELAIDLYNALAKAHFLAHDQETCPDKCEYRKLLADAHAKPYSLRNWTKRRTFNIVHPSK